MDRLEMAQRLREKANCSYEEARDALEQTEWDLLDAMTHLEREGKIRQAGPDRQKHQEEAKMEQHSKKTARQDKGIPARMVDGLAKLVDKGNRNYLVIKKGSSQPLTIPLTIAVLLALLFNGFTFLVVIVSLFLGYRYSFLSQQEVQQARQDIREAEEAAEQINHHHTVNSFGEPSQA